MLIKNEKNNNYLNYNNIINEQDKLTLKDIQNSDNIAELLSEESCNKIGDLVVRGYEIDEASRQEWKETIDQAMDIAKQKIEIKNSPWPKASNVKYPMIAKAAINFAARTMPTIIQNNRVVKCAIEGRDLKGLKLIRSNNVSDFMSYQLLKKINDWKRHTDKLLQSYAITGIAFKKTYYDPSDEEIKSEFCLPHKICINHNISTLELAPRITHILEYSQNDIIEWQRKGFFIDVSLIELSKDAMQDNDPNKNIDLLEQYCYLDLDCDGYKEPYIVTVKKESRKVLRIASNIDEIKRNKDGEILRIIPESYFTDFHFINNPDGGYYSIGYGQLLLHLNIAINAVLNQNINAGTLATTSAGLISQGVRFKNGEFKMKMGEYIPVEASSSTDLAKAIYTFPFKEPSDVLLKIMETLLKACDELSGINDTTKGSQQAQNVAASAINQLVEQSSQNHTAINERLYESLQSEYEKIYRLNNKYLKDSEYRRVLDDESVSVKKDFSLDDIHVYPVADPAMSTVSQKLTKANALMNLKTADPRAVDLYIVQALQLDPADIKKILPPKDPNAPPPLQDQEIQSKISLNRAQAAKLVGDTQGDQQRLQLEALKEQREQVWTHSQISESNARQWGIQKDKIHNDMKLAVTQKKMETEQLIKAAHVNLQAQKNQLDASLHGAQLKSDNTQHATDTQLAIAKMFSDSAQHSAGLTHDLVKNNLENYNDNNATYKENQNQAAENSNLNKTSPDSDMNKINESEQQAENQPQEPNVGV